MEEIDILVEVVTYMYMHTITYIHRYIHTIELHSTYSVKTDWYIGTTYIHF